MVDGGEILANVALQHIAAAGAFFLGQFERLMLAKPFTRSEREGGKAAGKDGLERPGEGVMHHSISKRRRRDLARLRIENPERAVSARLVSAVPQLALQSA